MIVPPTRRGRTRIVAVALLLVVQYGACPPATWAEPPRILKWAVEATVVELHDDDGIFPDVRLGDAVRGTIKYDAWKLLDIFGSFPETLHFFSHPTWFETASMEVINSRNGTSLKFTPDPAGPFQLAAEFNDFEGDFGGGFVDTGDGVFVTQSVVAPAGFQGAAPAVSVGLVGPPTVYSEIGVTMPEELALDDWPEAEIIFADFLASDESVSSWIVAEIYLLTLVPIGLGDFNGSGGVDEHDLMLWADDFGYQEDEFGFPLVPYADADLDGDADGNDFLVWQQNLGDVMNVAAAIPEPTTAVLVALGAGIPLLAATERRRRYRNVEVGAASSGFAGSASNCSICRRATAWWPAPCQSSSPYHQ